MSSPLSWILCLGAIALGVCGGGYVAVIPLLVLAILVEAAAANISYPGDEQ